MKCEWLIPCKRVKAEPGELSLIGVTGTILLSRNQLPFQLRFTFASRFAGKANESADVHIRVTGPAPEPIMIGEYRQRITIPANIDFVDTVFGVPVRFTTFGHYTAWITVQEGSTADSRAVWWYLKEASH